MKVLQTCLLTGLFFCSGYVRANSLDYFTVQHVFRSHEQCRDFLRPVERRLLQITKVENATAFCAPNSNLEIGYSIVFSVEQNILSSFVSRTFMEMPALKKIETAVRHVNRYRYLPNEQRIEIAVITKTTHRTVASSPLNFSDESACANALAARVQLPDLKDSALFSYCLDSSQGNHKRWNYVISVIEQASQPGGEPTSF